MKTTILTLTLAIASCPAASEHADERQKDGPAPSLESAREAAAATNAFGLDLYAHLRGRAGNLLLSPYSIATALAMAREGAAGETRAQMSAALHLGADGGGGHRDLALLLAPGTVRSHAGRTVKEVDAFELSTANRLWVERDLRVEQPFIDRLAAVFGAPLERVDFARPDAVRRQINAWVAKQTRDRIRDIVPDGQPSAETLLALVNAIYFKAQWAETFHDGATQVLPFDRGDTAVDVPMMRMSHAFAYAETDALQLVELPYRGHETSMVVLLPRSKNGLAKLEEGLDAPRLAAHLGALRSRIVALTLPKFRFEASFEASDALGRLGMTSAFHLETADFSGISQGQRLAINAVLHKAFIAVDEEGTEAAAATALMLVGAAANPEAPVPFVADHPFLFLIRHRATGAILFLGRVADPSR